MNILITGATGFVGTRLVHKLLEKGHQPIILTRSAKKAQAKLPDDVKVLEWDPTQQGEEVYKFSTDELQSVDGAINLAGENISEKRWSDHQKDKILNSRLSVTKALVTALNEYAPQSQFLVSASAIGYYPVNQLQNLDEQSNPGRGFLPEVCQRWESEAQKISSDKRLVITRIGVVLGPEGGALAKLLPIFKLGLGGKVGDGSQIMSWIHVDDLVKILVAAAEHETMKGVYNAVTPYPVTNKKFSKNLGKALGRPAIFPVPSFVLKLAMGEMGTIVLDSQSITSKKLNSFGFDFQYPKIDQALKDIVKQDKK